MTNTEQKWLREIRDNTKQLERIAKRLDAIHRQLDRLDRKDKPTISKMEQVDKDINVRSKDEPQTEYRIGYYTPTNAEILKALEDEQSGKE